MDIRETALQALEKAVADLVPFAQVHQHVADAVAVAVLREARFLAQGVVQAESVVADLDALLAAFTPAEPPQQGACLCAGREGDPRCPRHARPAEPQTPEPRKYSACRICGRGASNKSSHLIIAEHGVHTDANGKPNQPNKGTAYCDRCEDETLVIQPAAPVTPTYGDRPVRHANDVAATLAQYPVDVRDFMQSHFRLDIYPVSFIETFAGALDGFRPAAPVSSSARPDSQTVEQARAHYEEVLDTYLAASGVLAIGKATVALDAAINDLIAAAVRQEQADHETLLLSEIARLRAERNQALDGEQADARPARTLKDVVDELLTIYGVKFEDANSREVAIDTWARQLSDTLLSGETKGTTVSGGAK